MERQDPNFVHLMAAEGRCPLDTPVSEAEMENFDKFYRSLLGKKLEDKLSLVKGLTLVRRGDLRPYVQYAALFQPRYEAVIPPKQRDLLLSFPSVNKEVYHLIFSCVQSYGGVGETAVLLTKDQVNDHLDRTEMFRIDLDSLLGELPAILPSNKEMLAEFFEEIRNRPSERTFRFNIVTIADHAFLSVVPGTERSSTVTVGQIRTYLEQQFGERFEENLIEFFVVGGGYIRSENNNIIVGGRNMMFDPLFAEIQKPISEMYSSRFVEYKFQLAHQILMAELPEYTVNINRGMTGRLSLK
ncbi:MAG: hypothetical protein AB1489_41430 [Acidobacteriota bacterium]